MPTTTSPVQSAIATALALGITFHDIGDDAIGVYLPDGVDLPAGLTAEDLRAYFKPAEVADAAVAWLAELNIEARIVRTDAEYDAAISELSGADLVGIDIETTTGEPPAFPTTKTGALSKKSPRVDNIIGTPLDPLSAKIATTQLYAGYDRSFIFIGAMKDTLLRSGWLEQQRLCAHNAAFEEAFLRRAGVALTRPIEDSMLLLTGLLYGAPRDLATACYHVLGKQPPKDYGASYWGGDLDRGQTAYAAADAALTWVCTADMLPRIERGRRKIAYALTRDVTPIVVGMQLRGIGFDLEEHNRQLAQTRQDAAAANARYIALTGEAPPRTPAQIGGLVEEIISNDRVLGWPRTEKTGQLSTARAHLKRLADDPRVATLLEIRAKQKLLDSQFGAKLAGFVHPHDGRIHAGYRIGGTVTGRFSCAGPNLQQLPRARDPWFRRRIITRPGHVLLVADFDQVELRIHAHWTGCSEMTAAFAERRDLHRETASAIARVPYDEVSPEQRQRAKPVNFGAIFGMGPKKLCEHAFANYDILITEAEARDALDQFFERFPTRRFLGRHADLCTSRGHIEVPTSGRIIAASWMPGGQLTFSQCCNFPVQGAGGDLMLMAMLLVDARLPGTMVASVHDELLCEVPADQAEAAAVILTEAMTEAFSLTFDGAPSAGVVSTGIGANWCEAKP